MNVLDEHAQQCYLRYRLVQDNQSFTDLYAALKNMKSWHRAKVLSTGVGDVYDAESSFDDVLLGLLKRDDITDICRMLYVYLRYKRIDLHRKGSRWNDRVYYPESDVEFGATVDLVEPDRIGFIRELIERSGEEVAALITDMALADGGGESISALSGQAGLHHNTVFRAFKRLRRFYDEDIDGELSEYIA